MQTLFVQVGVNSFSATMVAGNSAATNADSLIYDVMAAIYTACASFMSQNLGAGKRDRVLKSYLISLAYSFGIGMAMGLALVAFGTQFLSLFTADPDVIAAGLKRLTIMGFSYGVSAFMDCTIAASRALGKSFAPMLIVIMGSCVFRVIWVYTVFAYFKTIPSLYLLLCLLLDHYSSGRDHLFPSYLQKYVFPKNSRGIMPGCFFYYPIYRSL